MKVSYYNLTQLKEGVFATNCLKCENTCHYPCTIWVSQWFCSAINWKGKCKICKQECGLSDHEYSNKKYVLSYKTEERTYEHLKKKYDDAKQKKASKEGMLSLCQQKADEAQARLLDTIEKQQRYQKELDEIALKPNPLTQPSYIQMLISVEEAEN